MLDDPAQRALVEADPAFAGAPAGTLLIDEWQRLPSVWDSVRRQVDDGAPPGRFLLTGSATPAPGVDTHTGAGRILSLRMRPLALYERGLAEPSISLRALLAGRSSVAGVTDFGAPGYFEAIEASGFPGTYRQPARLRRAMLDSYLQRVIDRDLPDLGLAVRRPETLRRWLAAYAAATSTSTSYSRILDATTAGDGSRPAKTTTIAYRDHLAQLWLLDPLPGWSPSRNPLRRLQQAPKHHLADPALAARLLAVSARTLATRVGLPTPARCSSRWLPSPYESQPRRQRLVWVTCAPAMGIVRSTSSWKGPKARSSRSRSSWLRMSPTLTCGTSSGCGISAQTTWSTLWC